MYSCVKRTNEEKYFSFLFSYLAYGEILVLSEHNLKKIPSWKTWHTKICLLAVQSMASTNYKCFLPFAWLHDAYIKYVNIVFWKRVSFQSGSNFWTLLLDMLPPYFANKRSAGQGCPSFRNIRKFLRDSTASHTWKLYSCVFQTHVGYNKFYTIVHTFFRKIIESFKA
jgi:hypothetical protein